jgi:Na+/melibiose symporter-like transporter
MVSGVGVFLSGLMLTIIAFPSHAQRGQVPPDALQSLALIYVPSMFVLYATTVVVMWFYKIDRATHEANLAILAKRRGEGSPTDEKHQLVEGEVEGASRVAG